MPRRSSCFAPSWGWKSPSARRPHRNSLSCPPELPTQLRLKSAPHIRFAGQITGCEGYVESAAIGLIAARFAAAELAGRTFPPPPETALGALLGHYRRRRCGVLSAHERQLRVAPPLSKMSARNRSRVAIMRGAG